MQPQQFFPASLTDDVRSVSRMLDVPVAHAVSCEDVGQSMCHVIRRTNLELARSFAASVGDRYSIRPCLLGVLMVVGANPGLGQVDIANQLGLDKANAAELIRNLESNHFIARRRSQQDRRRQGVFLTPRGVQRLAELRRETHVFEQSTFACFTQEERDVLLQLLKRLTVACEQTTRSFSQETV